MNPTNFEKPKCYICTSDDIPLYKICSCADSFLCLECLKLTEEKMNSREEGNYNRFKCDVCRQNLTLYNFYSFKYYQNMLSNLGLRLFFWMVDLFPFSYIHLCVNTKYPSSFFTSDKIFIYLSLINILFFRYSFKLFLSSLFKIEPSRISFYYTIDIIFSLVTISTFCLCFLESTFQMIDLYAVLVLIFNYQLSFLIVWLMYSLDSLGNLMLQLRLKYQNYKILVRSSYFPIIEDEITDV